MIGRTDSTLVLALERASRLPHPSQISVSGFGSISVYPDQHVYSSDITDWDSLPFCDSSQVHVVGTVWEAPPRHSLPISELQWRTRLTLAQRDAHVRPLPLMVRLVSWPDLADVPEELAPQVARICALLTCKATAVILLPRLVSLAPETSQALVQVLMDLGHVVAYEVDGTHGPAAARASAQSESEQVDAAPANGMLSKLWKRLSRRS